MQSKETVDVYATKEPQAAFHERIEFCLNLHNDAVKVRCRAIPRMLVTPESPLTEGTLWKLRPVSSS